MTANEIDHHYGLKEEKKAYEKREVTRKCRIQRCRLPV